jgi:hypothetical protein
MKRPANSQLFKCRREVAILAHKGWTQATIARHLQLPPATVSRDLAAMREFWREFPASDSGCGRTSRRNRISERGAHLAARKGRIVASRGRFVAPIYRFCATPGFTLKCYVSLALARVSRDFRAIPSDRKKLGESHKCGDASAGPDRGSGDAMQLAMNSPTFEKLRMCAMRDR